MFTRWVPVHPQWTERYTKGRQNPISSSFVKKYSEVAIIRNGNAILYGFVTNIIEPSTAKHPGSHANTLNLPWIEAVWQSNCKARNNEWEGKTARRNQKFLFNMMEHGPNWFQHKIFNPRIQPCFLAEVTLKKALDLGVLHSCSNTSCYSCSTGIGSSRWPGKKGFEILVTIHSLTPFRKSWKVLLRGWCDMEDKLLVTFKL